jgi:hypothetical protein
MAFCVEAVDRATDDALEVFDRALGAADRAVQRKREELERRGRRDIQTTVRRFIDLSRVVLEAHDSGADVLRLIERRIGIERLRVDLDRAQGVARPQDAGHLDLLLADHGATGLTTRPIPTRRRGCAHSATPTSHGSSRSSTTGAPNRADHPAHRPRAAAPPRRRLRLQLTRASPLALAAAGPPPLARRAGRGRPSPPIASPSARPVAVSSSWPPIRQMGGISGSDRSSIDAPRPRFRPSWPSAWPNGDAAVELVHDAGERRRAAPEGCHTGLSLTSCRSRRATARGNPTQSGKPGGRPETSEEQPRRTGLG